MTLEFTTFHRNESARTGVLAYIRVSSEEQADRRASLEEQRRRIQEHFEGRLGLKILEWYADEGASAFKDDEKRENFWRMIERAKSDPRVGIIAVDEESRFYRQRHKSAGLKGELLEHGVVVQTVTRNVDPRTTVGIMIESIEEALAQAQSVQNREHTLRGMAGNARQRDPETGWTYKNGGSAPFGWTLVRLEKGTDAKGRRIGRTIWALDPPAAEIRRQILLWRAKGWTYQTIRDELNRLRAPSPKGGAWSTSSIVAICREDMVWTAAGYSVWNKHQRKQKKPGEKWKPVDEWVVEPNGHPAIITEEEARAVLAVNKQRRHQHSDGQRKQVQSPYLVRGDNSEGEPLFVCEVCGARVIPYNYGKGRAFRYICATKKYKGANQCPSSGLDGARFEAAVVELLSSRFTRQYILDVIEAANQAAQADSELRAVDHRQARLKKVEEQIRNIERSILSGVNPERWASKLNELDQERVELLAAIEEDREAPQQKYRPISRDDAEKLADELIASLSSPTLPERRLVLVSMVRQFTLAKAKGRVYVDLHPDPLDLAAPTFFAVESGNKLVPPRGRILITVRGG